MSYAIGSKFGWILSVTNGKIKKKSNVVSSNIANLQTMFIDNITRKIDDDLNLEGSILRFWEVENIGVDEHSVYENFKQAISFDENVMLPLYYLDHFINHFLTIAHYRKIEFLF